MSTKIKLLRSYIQEVLSSYGKDGVSGNLMNNIPTSGHMNSNILDDEEQDNLNEFDDNKLRAAICLIRSKDGLILAVSRKDNPNDFEYV